MGTSSKLRNLWCAVALSAATVVAAHAASPTDQHLMREATEANSAEIELVRLAQHNTSAHDVMNFRARMVTDHSKLNKQWQCTGSK